MSKFHRKLTIKDDTNSSSNTFLCLKRRLTGLLKPADGRPPLNTQRQDRQDRMSDDISSTGVTQETLRGSGGSNQKALPLSLPDNNIDRRSTNLFLFLFTPVTAGCAYLCSSCTSPPGPSTSVLCQLQHRLSHYVERAPVINTISLLITMAIATGGFVRHTPGPRR